MVAEHVRETSDDTRYLESKKLGGMLQVAIKREPDMKNVQRLRIGNQRIKSIHAETRTPILQAP